MLSHSKVEEISFEVIKVLVTAFEQFSEHSSEGKGSPFHIAYLNAFTDKFRDNESDAPFFISMSSWLHGLNAALRSVFFENVSNILCDGTSCTFDNLKISEEQESAILHILSDLAIETFAPNVERENQLIFRKDSVRSRAVPSFTVNCFYQEKDRVVAIELKTFKPNSTIVKGDKEKVLFAKAALKNVYPDKLVVYYIGIPFGPSSKPSSSDDDETILLGSSLDMSTFFAAEEVLIVDELWDHLSGEKGTMQQLLEIINRIATNEFLSNIDFINNRVNKKQDVELYKTKLEELNLRSELILVKNDTLIQERIKNERSLVRVYNQLVFDGDGNYNVERFKRLSQLIGNV